VFFGERLEITELCATLIVPGSTVALSLVGISGILQVIRSIVDRGLLQCGLLYDSKCLFQSLVRNLGAEGASLSILDEEDDNIRPVEQELSGIEFLCSKLCLETNSVLAEHLVLGILSHLSDGVHALLTALHGRCVDLLVEVSKVLYCQDDST
jgi:hypothetical protein